MSRPLSTAVAALLLLASGPSFSSKYRVYELKRDTLYLQFTVGNDDRLVAWLDDKRILFEAYGEVLKVPPLGTSIDKNLRGLYVWNIESGSVERYTKEPLRDFMCFADGFVAYLVHRDGRDVRLEGIFGSEQEVEQPPLSQRIYFNRFACKYYRPADLPAPKFGGGLHPLRAEDGWLERLQGGAWIRPRSGPETKLTVANLGLGSFGVHKYSKFAHKYLYYLTYRDQYETWAFSMNGTLERMVFPAGPWRTGRIEPAGKGLLLRSHWGGAQNNNWHPGNAGLYYLPADSTKPEKLLAGSPYSIDVSADGCRIAAFIDPWDREDRTHQLKAVDLCR